MNYKEYTVAFGILLVVIFVGNANKHSTEASYQHPAETGGHTTWSGVDEVPETNAATLQLPQVASRYHLRNRTTRSFKLAVGQMDTDGSRQKAERDGDSVASEGRYLASRYHLRNRTKELFTWSAGSVRVGQKVSPVEREARPTRTLGTQLAARYHLRDRTARFFERASESTQVS